MIQYIKHVVELLGEEDGIEFGGDGGILGLIGGNHIEVAIDICPIIDQEL
jgi:hypothetical protein